MKTCDLHIIDEKAALLTATSDFIFDHPEPCYQEFQSSEYLMQALEKEGFHIEAGLANIKTAFSAAYGSGRPIIGILGEYDALSGLNQVAGCTVPCVDKEKTNGHGCGHNLLAAASMGAAIAVKDYLQTHRCSGTVVFLGCPAEEGGSAKAFMARDGVFDDLDVALTWHPDDTTGIRMNTSLANVQVLYSFTGTPSHAAKQPQLGRSALDGLELMNVGVNFLREHMIDDARIHYSIIDAGGFSPNVVQGHAAGLFLIRAPQNDQVQELYTRVTDIAKGAALMTGTKAENRIIKACSNTIFNHTLNSVLYAAMQKIPLPEIDEKDIAFARELVKKSFGDIPGADVQHPIHYELEPYRNEPKIAHGSTDVGDVSWVCPTAQLKASTHAFKTPNHSWQQVTQGKQPLAHKMTIYIAKCLAAAAIDLIEHPQLVEQARQEHRSKVADGYKCPIPKDVVPGVCRLEH